MKLTVITVCFNAEKTIERTFNSVISQKDKDFEYIIVDGKSSDGTIRLIKDWEDAFVKSGISYRWISEKDTGLYDAMNKAALMAAGDWIVYLNADDEFASNETIKYAKEHMDSNTDILYGNTIFVDKNGNMEKRMALDADTITKHLPFIPQSAFIKTEVQKEFLFNLNYKIVADFDSFLRMYIAEKNFKKVDYCFAKFYEGGVSNRNEWETYKEDILVKHANGILNKHSIVQKIKYVRRWIQYKV